MYFALGISGQSRGAMAARWRSSTSSISRSHCSEKGATPRSHKAAYTLAVDS
jgi:hypothetical protein